MVAPRNPFPRKDVLVRMDADLAVQLEAYCLANEGSQRNFVIVKAIRTYIEERLRNDAELRERHGARREEILARVPAGMRLVTNKAVS